MDCFRFVMKLAFSAGILGFSVPGHGFPRVDMDNATVCNGSVRSASISGFSKDMVHKVALVGDEDRQSEKTYQSENGMTPEEYQKLFGAAGQIECPWWVPGTPSASGSVNCSGDVMSTNAHIFVDEKTGRLWGRPSACSLVVSALGKHGLYKEKIPLTDDMIAGVNILNPKMSNAERLRELRDASRDFAVIKLKRHAQGVTPLEVWKKNPLTTDPGNLDLYGLSGPQIDMEYPTIAHCYYHDAEAPKTPGFGRGLGTDCDSQKGGSGGPDVRIVQGMDGTAHVVLVSIHGRSTPRNTRGPYDLYANSSYSVLVEKKLQEAFTEMCAPGSIKSDEMPSAQKSDIDPGYDVATGYGSSY